MRTRHTQGLVLDLSSPHPTFLPRRPWDTINDDDRFIDRSASIFSSASFSSSSSGTTTVTAVLLDVILRCCRTIMPSSLPFSFIWSINRSHSIDFNPCHGGGTHSPQVVSPEKQTRLNCLSCRRKQEAWKKKKCFFNRCVFSTESALLLSWSSSQ